jgi:hypothetical protein
MSELSRNAELQIREENGDPGAARVPRRRLRTQTPYAGGLGLIPQYAAELVYFFPRECLWALSAKGFAEVKSGDDIPNSANYYSFLIEHIFHTAFNLGEGKEGGVEKQIVTWTLVPHVAKEWAGYLVRVVYQIDPTKVADEIAKHVSACTEQDKKNQNSGRKIIKESYFNRFTCNEYVQTAQYYLGSEVGNRADAADEMAIVGSAWCPFSIYSLKNAVKLMVNAGAHPDFTSMHEYISANDTVSFPRDGTATYLLNPSQLAPAEMRRSFFPHTPRTFAHDNLEFDNFLIMQGINPRAGAADDGGDFMAIDGADSEADGHGLSREEKIERARAIYTELASSAEVEASNSLQSFKKRVEIEFAAAKKAAGKSKKQQALNRREAQLKMIRAFETDIFTPDDTSDCGDAVRAIAKYYHTVLRSRPNFCMPTPKSTVNLTRFADLQIRETATYEAVWAINTAHQEVKSLRVASMHVYFYSAFHCHTACTGPPASGKSNAFSVNLMRLIDGTYRDIGNESAKAKNTPGKKTDLMIECYEDVQPSQVGVSANNGRNDNSGTSNTSEEAALKYRLTKGRVTSVYKSVENGVHKMIQVDSYCNTVMLMGANFTFEVLPSAIAGRFNCIQFPHRERNNAQGHNMGLFTKSELAKDGSIQVLRDLVIQRDRRNQVFHAIIELLCYTGVLHAPVMKVAEILWTNTMMQAKKNGLHETTNIRHYERLRFHCETLVVEDAIERMLDSEIGLDPSQPWMMKMIVEFEKHLWANTEHAAMALGLLQHQWENPTILALERFFSTKLLKHKIRNKDVGKHDPNEALMLEMSYYYVVKFDTTPLHSANTFADKGRTQQQEQLRRLAQLAHQLMTPKPSINEITHGLQCLMDLQIQVENKASKTTPKETMHIPALAFSRDGEVMVAEAMMRLQDKDSKNRLQSCFRSVATYEDTVPKNILYGRTREDTPHIWQTMKFNPIKGRKLQLEEAAHFTPQVLDFVQDQVRFIEDAEHASTDDYRERFSVVPSQNIDMDLDEWMSQKHAIKVGLAHFPATRDAPGGETTPEAIKAACMKMLTRAQRAKLPLYPKDLPETSPLLYKAQIAADQVKHPEKYSMRAGLNQLKREAMHESEDDDEDANEDQQERKYNEPKRRRVEDDASAFEDEEDLDEDVDMCSDGDIDENCDEDEDDDAPPAVVAPPPPIAAAASVPQRAWPAAVTAASASASASVSAVPGCRPFEPAEWSDLFALHDRAGPASAASAAAAAAASSSEVMYDAFPRR